MFQENVPELEVKNLKLYNLHENNDPEWPTARHVLIKLWGFRGGKMTWVSRQKEKIIFRGKSRIKIKFSTATFVPEGKQNVYMLFEERKCKPRYFI